jgi:predicted acylesterase/phospholipase RssA
METANVISSWTLRIAIAMSGGGFRASLFHLGVLKAFGRIGLPQID